LSSNRCRASVLVVCLVLANAAVLRGAPPAIVSSTGNAYESGGEQRISGAQSASRGETAIRVNRYNPRQIVAASKNLPPGAARGYSGAQMAIFHSSDGGVSWGQSYLPWAAGDVFMGDPSVDWTSDGTAWATIIAVPMAGPLAVRAYKSIDGGATWALDATLSTPNFSSDKEMMWVDHSATSPFKDNIYVIWNALGVWMARRNGPDGTWQAPRPLAGGGFGSDVKTNQYGDVFVFFPGQFVVKSTDGGTTFGAPVRIAATFGGFGTGVPANNGRGVLIYTVGGAYRTASRDEVYMAWNDLSGDPGCTSGGDAPGANAASTCKTRIFFSRSIDGGSTWSAPIKINDPPVLDDQFFPWLVVDEATGRLAVSYYDTAGDASRTSVNVYYQSSIDGGQSWSRPLQVTTAATNETTAGASWFQFGDYAGMDGFSGVFFPAWTDRRSGGPEEIWTAAILDGPCTSPRFAGCAVNLGFYTLQPCRVLDTRGGTPLASGMATLVQVTGRCGVPADAKAVSANWTIVQPKGSGVLTIYPGDAPLPLASTLNFSPGQVRANNAMVLLAGDGSGRINAFASVGGGGTTDLILDVNGYFK
jgi:hypothetical protein